MTGIQLGARLANFGLQPSLPVVAKHTALRRQQLRLRFLAASRAHVSVNRSAKACYSCLSLASGARGRRSVTTNQEADTDSNGMAGFE